MTKKTASERWLEVQQEIGAIKKDKSNPYFNSSYADINDLLEVVKPILNKHGFTVNQPPEATHASPDKIFNKIKTLILDSESGEVFMDGSMALPDVPDPQKLGSAVTYYRRYSLQSLLSLQAVDDDGNNASQQAPAQKDYDAFTDGLGIEEESVDMVCEQCGGPMEYKEGTAKTGKPYKAWFCKTDRKHKPVWL